MQSTGLKDSEGRLVFDGDILEISYQRYLIYYSKKWACFRVKRYANDTNIKDIKSIISREGYKVGGFVIGNIYENSEYKKEFISWGD